MTKYSDIYNEQAMADKLGVGLRDLSGMRPVSQFRAMMIRMSGRSWWEAKYASGKQIAEWETIQGKVLTPLGNPATSRWEEIDKRGLVALRLLCPNGKAGALLTSGSYNLFQLKSGVSTVTVAPAGVAVNPEPTLHCHYHIIGAVTDTNGTCECYAWDYQNKELLKFKDNVTHMAFDNIGPLNLGEAVGIK